jgi:hypothetical protein
MRLFIKSLAELIHAHSKFDIAKSDRRWLWITGVDLGFQVDTLSDMG